MDQLSCDVKKYQMSFNVCMGVKQFGTVVCCGLDGHSSVREVSSGTAEKFGQADMLS